MTNTYQAITGLTFARNCTTMMMTIVSASLVAQTAPYDSAKPLAHATLFAPGIISTGDYESPVGSRGCGNALRSGGFRGQ